MQPVTVAAASGTHFTYEGDLYPRTFYVFPSRADDARLVSGSWSLEVPLGSTVGGSVPADQAALIDALAALVTPGSDGGTQAVSLVPGTGTPVVLTSAATTTGAKTAVDVPKAYMGFTAILTGTGAISATVVIQMSDGTNWFDGPSFVLSGTTSVSDQDWFDNVYPQLRCNVTAISGTGAALTVRAVY